MNLLDLMVKVTMKDEASDKVAPLSSNLRDNLAKASRVAKAGLVAVSAAATAVVGGLQACVSATEDFRLAQGKLTTAFSNAGLSSEAATQAFTDFYSILGDIDTAAEASQLLARLSMNQEDLATWTHIATGVWGTFGDSLPIEGLIESANETQNVGKVVGPLADALNWVGIKEDDFNAALEECNTTAERNQLIMQTLLGAYDNAANAFEENNAAIMQQRENSAQMQQALSGVATSWLGITNAITSSFLPGIQSASASFSGFLDKINPALIEGLRSAMEALGAAIDTYIRPVLDGLSYAWGHLMEVIEPYIPAIQKIAEITGGFLVAVIGLAIGVIAMAIEIVAQIIEAIKQFVQVLVNVGTRIAEFVASFAEAWQNLKSSASEAWENLKSTVSNGVNSVVEFIKSLPSKIVEALGDLGSLLFDAGESIIKGLWDGLKSMWEGVKSWFGNITSAIPDLKGPEDVDARLLVKNGGVIIGGLLEGMKSEWSEVESYLSSRAGVINGAMTFSAAYAGAPAAMGNVYNFGDINIEASDLSGVKAVEDFVALVERAKRANPRR